MKAMLEPRIVAARIQRPTCFVHGTSALIDRITASSHADFIEVMDALRVDWIRDLHQEYASFLNSGSERVRDEPQLRGSVTRTTTY